MCKCVDKQKNHRFTALGLMGVSENYLSFWKCPVK